jgi:hypothetical protein
VLSYEEAYMQLILGNQQDGMSNLEIGKHVLNNVYLSKGGRGKEGGLREYARNVGAAQSNLTNYRKGAEVLASVENRYDDISLFLDKALHLAAIHKSPAPAWPALVSTFIEDGWSVTE